MTEGDVGDTGDSLMSEFEELREEIRQQNRKFAEERRKMEEEKQKREKEFNQILKVQVIILHAKNLYLNTYECDQNDFKSMQKRVGTGFFLFL